MVTDFSLSSEVKGKTLIIKTNGYINHAGGEKIAEVFNEHKNGVSKVVLDLKNSKVVNSIGISYMIEIIEKLNEAKGKLFFANLDPTIEKTFNIMGLFQFAQKTETIDDALQK